MFWSTARYSTTGPGSSSLYLIESGRGATRRTLAGGSPNDHPCPVVRAQDDSVTPRPRPRSGRSGQSDLAEKGRQEHLHLVERERHPQTDPVPPAEREPLVRAELP